MKEKFKKIVVLNLIVIIVSMFIAPSLFQQLGILNVVQAYDHKAKNILDNVFTSDNKVILPFIFTKYNQTIKKSYIESEFKKAGKQILNLSSLGNTIKTGDVIKTNKESYTVLIYGDVNGDGEVDIFDAQRVLRHYVYGSKSSYNLKGIYKVAGNVKNDDNEVDTFDAQRILKFSVGIEKKLVVKEPKANPIKDEEPTPPAETAKVNEIILGKLNDYITSITIKDNETKTMELHFLDQNGKEMDVAANKITVEPQQSSNIKVELLDQNDNVLTSTSSENVKKVRVKGLLETNNVSLKITLKEDTKKTLTVPVTVESTSTPITDPSVVVTMNNKDTINLYTKNLPENTSGDMVEKPSNYDNIYTLLKMELMNSENKLTYGDLKNKNLKITITSGNETISSEMGEIVLDGFIDKNGKKTICDSNLPGFQGNNQEITYVGIALNESKIESTHSGLLEKLVNDGGTVSIGYENNGTAIKVVNENNKELNLKVNVTEVADKINTISASIASYTQGQLGYYRYEKYKTTVTYNGTTNTVPETANLDWTIEKGQRVGSNIEYTETTDASVSTTTGEFIAKKAGMYRITPSITNGPTGNALEITVIENQTVNKIELDATEAMISDTLDATIPVKFSHEYKQEDYRDITIEKGSVPIDVKGNNVTITPKGITIGADKSKGILNSTILIDANDRDAKVNETVVTKLHLIRNTGADKIGDNASIEIEVGEAKATITLSETKPALVDDRTQEEKDKTSGIYLSSDNIAGANDTLGYPDSEETEWISTLFKVTFENVKKLTFGDYIDNTVKIKVTIKNGNDTISSEDADSPISIDLFTEKEDGSKMSYNDDNATNDCEINYIGISMIMPEDTISPELLAKLKDETQENILTITIDGMVGEIISKIVLRD